MSRKKNSSESFESTRRRPVRRTGAYSAADIARFEAMRTVFDAVPDDNRPPVGDRWSIWAESEPLQRGPQPWPEWVITDDGAVDFELGAVKSGKEADVCLIERVVPQTDRSTVLVSKRYRSAEHTQFNRAGDYTAGRGTKRSRDARALAKRTTFGLAQAASRWAAAEFDALTRFYVAGVPVPYPVQVHDTEVVMEFIGDSRRAAPRLAECRPEHIDVVDLWDQACLALRRITELGCAHGDLSAYNTVVHDERLIVLDLPQVVDLYANPLGVDFLIRDVENLGGWFVKHGVEQAAVDDLRTHVLAIASMR